VYSLHLQYFRRPSGPGTLLDTNMTEEVQTCGVLAATGSEGPPQSQPYCLLLLEDTGWANSRSVYSGG
jgi:hypothetical protein